MSEHYPDSPGYKDPGGAGHDAAIAFQPKLGHRRAEVLQTYERLGTATPDEVARVIDRPPHVTRPRVSELFLLGELVKTGERKPSAFGAGQTVYRRATPTERALHAANRAANAERCEGGQ